MKQTIVALMVTVLTLMASPAIACGEPVVKASLKFHQYTDEHIGSVTINQKGFTKNKHIHWTVKAPNKTYHNVKRVTFMATNNGQPWGNFIYGNFTFTAHADKGYKIKGKHKWTVKFKKAPYVDQGN